MATKPVWIPGATTVGSLGLEVTVRGPFFSSRIDKVVKDAIVDESLNKVNERINRPGRWQRRRGARRNTVTTKQQALILDFNSTLNNPRNIGVAWARTNMGIIRSMLPRVLNKTAQRIEAELN